MEYRVRYIVDVNDTPGIDNMVICMNLSCDDTEENIWELECYVQQWIIKYLYDTFGLSYKNFSYDYEIERV